MLKSAISALAAAALIVTTAPAAGQPQTASPAPTAPAPAPAKSGHVDARGVRYYYEIHGQGRPLLLLHGGLGSIDMFRPLLPALAKNRQVIAIDLHGHGRTTLGSRPISLEAMGADMADILNVLSYEQVDVFGYSMGAGVAFQLAVQHPETVRALALASAGFAQDGFYPEMLPMQAQVGAAMADFMKETPMYKSYVAVAPNPGDFPRLLDAMGAMMRKPYDWSADVAKIKAPTILIYGDSDMFRLEHVVKFYQLLGGGQRDAGWQREHMARNRLAILPGLTHYDIFLSPLFVDTALAFLDGKAHAANWGDKPAR